MSDLQDRVGQWGEVTFPFSTPKSIVAHLRDEVDELADAIREELDSVNDGNSARNEKATTALAVEAADCYLLLLHLAHRYGFDLQDEAEAKFRVVQRRTYTTDSGRGYVRHDDEGGARP